MLCITPTSVVGSGAIFCCAVLNGMQVVGMRYKRHQEL